MSRRSHKRRNRPARGGFGKTQPGKLQADPTLALLLSQALDLPDEHCLIVEDSIGQQGWQCSPEFMAHALRVGARARIVNPADPAAAIKASLVAMLPTAGGMH